MVSAFARLISSEAVQLWIGIKSGKGVLDGKVRISRITALKQGANKFEILREVHRQIEVGPGKTGPLAGRTKISTRKHLGVFGNVGRGVFAVVRFFCGLVTSFERSR